MLLMKDKKKLKKKNHQAATDELQNVKLFTWSKFYPPKVDNSQQIEHFK